MRASDQIPHAPATGAWWLRLAGEKSLDRLHKFSFRYPTDGLGDAIHLVIACICCLFIALPISVTEIVYGILLGCWGIRLPFIKHSLLLHFRQWPFLLLLLFIAWQAITLLETNDLWAGIQQWGVLRYAAFALALYPLARPRGLLLLCLAAGFFIATLAQVALVLQPSLAGHLGLRLPSVEGRVGAWWPVVTMGEGLVAILAIHLGALRHARSIPVAAVASIGAASSLVGILITGTRGAWLAAAALCVIWACIFITTRARRGFGLLITAFVAIALLATLTAALTPSIQTRITDARKEIARMIDRGEYQTNIGLRVKMAQWGWDAWKEHPWTGIGPGDFRGWVLAKSESATPNEQAAIEVFSASRHGHPHNALLGVAVSSGIPAAVLLVALTATGGIIAARRGTRQADGSTLVRAYAAGPAWIILAMTLLWPFDVVTQSVQPATIFMLGLALAPGWLPSMPGDEP
jgi:O-antigen ligase